MKTQNAQMEVLLITGTHLLSQELSEKGQPRREGGPLDTDRLMEACWNGLLGTILPEIFDPCAGNRRLFVWEITATATALHLDMSEAPVAAESRFSINPYCFLSAKSFN